jgi:signal transduction histidine kinase
MIPSLCFSNTNLELFFECLKLKDYECASLHVNNQKDEALARKMIKLLKILEFQKPLIEKSKYLKSAKGHEVIDNLIEGHNELFLDNYSSIIAYEAFSKALNESNLKDNKELTKFCLVSILEVLRKEIFIGSKQFVTYLNHFRELAKNQDDEIILAYFEVVFSSKENEDLNVGENYDAKMEKFDLLFEGLDSIHSFYPFYGYEKGTQFKLREDYPNASSWVKKALEYCDKPHLKNLKSTLYWQLSHNYLLMEDLQNAEFYLRLSENTSSGLRDKFYDHRLKAWILDGKKQFDSAYYYLNSSVELEYRMGAKNNTLETALLSVENETDKLKLDKLTLDNRRKTNQTYLILAITALIFGLGIAILLQKNTTKKRKLAEQEALLEQQKVTTLLKEQELTSIDAMIAGQEKERTKVANELHDDLGSLMATVKLHFDNVKVDQKDPALINAQKLLDEAYQKIRGMAHSKNSGVMANQGLLPAVKKMAKIINETNSLTVTVEDFGLGERMENSLELTIFRMIQELVANIIKHAEATKASIQFTQHEDNLNIIVEDNGKGFDMTSIKRTQHGMGLGTIEKRIEHLEGSFTVDSLLDKGTSILIDIPV